MRLTPSMSQADLDPLWAREDIHTYPSGLSRAAARAIHTYPSRDVPRRLMYVEKKQNAAKGPQAFSAIKGTRRERQLARAPSGFVRLRLSRKAAFRKKRRYQVLGQALALAKSSRARRVRAPSSQGMSLERSISAPRCRARSAFARARASRGCSSCNTGRAPRRARSRREASPVQARGAQTASPRLRTVQTGALASLSPILSSGKAPCRRLAPFFAQARGQTLPRLAAVVVRHNIT